MPRGGKRPGAGRKPGTSRQLAVTTEHRTNDMSLDGSPADLSDLPALLEPLVPLALRVLAENLQQGKVSAAKDVLDRAYGKPPIRQNDEPRTPITVIFVDRDSGQIDHRIVIEGAPPDPVELPSAPRRPFTG